MATKPIPRKPISLALQGGGAHGARLLEDGRVEIQAVTGASAGAINAVALAQGLIDGGTEGGRKRLDSLWRAINQAGGRNIFGDTGVWGTAVAPDWLKATPGWRMAESFASSFSPYEFNPLNLNPFHDVLEAQINFKAIRERSPIRLYISATAVRTSESRIFRTPELTARHILASSCLPHLFQAVEIDGEPYWDGGYLANPALWPLFYDPTPRDILIVNLNPFVRDQTPKTPGEIVDRLNEITFNSSLVAELRAVAFVQKLIEDGLLKESVKGRYRHMLIHAIGADRWLDDLTMDSKFDTEWGFLTCLKERGRKAADEWLDRHLDDVGIQSSASAAMAFP